MVWSLACTTKIVSFSQNDGAGITLQEAGAGQADAEQGLDRRSDQGPEPDAGKDAQSEDARTDVAPDRQLPDGLPDRPQQPPLYRYVEYVCCPMDAANVCVSAFLGNAATCADASSWKEAAALECERPGIVLTDYAVYLDCSAEAVAPGSAPAPRCFFAEKSAKNTRCLVCDEGSGATTQYCETLSCSTVQADPTIRCDQCRWSLQATPLCDMCYDPTTGRTTRDSCYGQKAPE